MPADPDHILSRTQSSLLRSLGADNDDDNPQHHCPVYGDLPSQMTGGRLVARFLAKYCRCYYTPHDSVQLDAAWAHYEHYTLARIYSDAFLYQRQWIRAPPGERDQKTLLYPLWSTPVKSLADFGVSVRMYFSTLLTLSSFLAVAGVLNLPLLLYFGSDAYTDHSKLHHQSNSWAVQGSAVCVDTVPVECVDCAANGGKAVPERNECNFDGFLWPGILSWCASLVLLAQFGVAFFWLERKAEVVFDEEIQTASDYSIKISNPPPDATDPQEWRDFLSTFGHVSYVTVAIDNAALLKVLLQHKKVRHQLAAQLPTEYNVHEDQLWANPARIEVALRDLLPNNARRHRKARNLWNKLQRIQQRAKALLHPKQQQYKAVAVFCTFETERAQRNTLHTLTPSKLDLVRNKLAKNKHFDEHDESIHIEETVENSRFGNDFWHLTEQAHETETFLIRLSSSHDNGNSNHPYAQNDTTSSLWDQSLRFRGRHVVNVKEASEPLDVRWRDLQVSHLMRVLEYMGTTVAVLVFMTWSALFISKLHSQNDELPVFVLPMFIAVTNVIVPKICEFINKFESHSTDGSRQASLYVKVALFRWFNSALALLLVIGFTNTISFSSANSQLSLNQMAFNLIFAEMFTIPIIKLCDFMGFIRKHILAPRAQDQDEMNSYFQGAKFELAERYTDASKVLFVALFYSAILPASLFLGAFALMIHFCQAKFCLLRMWRPAPDVGPGLARLSRNYFFSLALLIHVVMSAYWWSGYPFDNLCASVGDDESSSSGLLFHFCNQDFMRSGVFPPLPRFQPEGQEWMTESQATITSLYAWTAVVMLTVAIGLAFKENILPYLQSIFKNTYEPDGADQKIPFSDVKHLAEVTTYVPMIREPGFSHCQLVCDISKIDHDVIGWKDKASEDYSHHSLYHEATLIIGGQEPNPNAFSKIQEWKVVEDKEPDDLFDEEEAEDEEEEGSPSKRWGYGTFGRVARLVGMGWKAW